MIEDVMPKRDQLEIYLGDGLYASFDGFGFWLRAPRERGDDRICLEPDVLRAFLKYVEKIKLGSEA